MTVAAILDWMARRKIALAMGFGILLRLLCYFSRSSYWMDEMSLLANVEGPRPIGITGPLLNHQLAPPGFLLTAWGLARMFGAGPWILKLIPLAAAIGGMFLFLAIARRVLSPRGVFPAVLMFASSNHLIYYASEFKQYSTDILATLACLMVGLTIGSKPLTTAKAAGLAGFGAALVWFSHPSIFVLTSVGLVGLWRAIAAKNRRWVGLWMAVGSAWLVSFAGVHRLSKIQLGGSDQMWRFWGFAFPPMPPQSVWDATWIFRRLGYYFLNPLDFGVPFDARICVIPAVGLAVAGFVRLARSDRQLCALLFLPVVATVSAAMLQLYPFHGRLVLFLAPIPLLGVAAGLDAVREIPGKAGTVAFGFLVAMVLVFPAIFAVDKAFDGLWTHNYLGDLFPADVDPYRFPF